MDLEDFYRRYLERCNGHRFDELDEFVHPDVVVGDDVHGIAAYVEGLAEVVEAIPDFHWELRHLLVEGEMMAAHLRDTGTTRDGRTVQIEEFSVYRVAHGRIVQVWGDLERARLGLSSDR